MAPDSRWLEHCGTVSGGLLELRQLLSDNNEAKRWFDEYLEANELELALHAVCRFLIEDASREIGDKDLNLIQSLHEIMHIADDCCAKLRRREAKM